MRVTGLTDRWRSRDARVIDGLIALVLAVALQLQIALGGAVEATPAGAVLTLEHV